MCKRNVSRPIFLLQFPYDPTDSQKWPYEIVWIYLMRPAFDPNARLCHYGNVRLRLEEAQKILYLGHIGN